MAVFLTHLAIIGRRDPELGYWVDEGLQQKALPLESAEKVSQSHSQHVGTRRRLEIVADGLPLFGGVQLAVDTTLVSPLHFDGSPHRGAANIDGALLAVARHKKETTHPELTGPNARLVVLAGETGARWSEETRSFVGLLAKAKSREVLGPEETCRAVLVVSMGSLLACGSPSFRRVLVGCACLRRSRWFGAQLS